LLRLYLLFPKYATGKKSPFYRTAPLVYCGHNTGKEQNAVEYNIVWVRGHVEVYDWAGRFCFSADNEREAREELASEAA